MLQGKKILLGVSGSIAAYKAAMLTRLLIKAGAEVKVVMTQTATEFITPLTLSTLSKNPVLTDFVKDKTGQWNNHVELGLWADVMLIAPITANTLGKMANGLCDNLLLATYLSARCPVFVAPAMDLDMYAHPSTRENLQKITGYGNKVIEVSFGELASGLIGNGRMAEPEFIVNYLSNHFRGEQKLAGKRALITAGPTYEAIDPVRFIGNHSSGKMGYALAQELASQGAEVDLVSGPSNQTIEVSGVKVTKVTSAEEMYEACSQIFPASDINILAAAVADYRPQVKFEQKFKKKSEEFDLKLTKTKDIAYELGKLKKDNQFTVGFALETENEVEHAQKKLQSKNFDMIVLNSLQDKGAGFGHNTNKVTLIDRDNNIEKFELKTKKEVAQDIVTAIISKIKKNDE
ncbi:MAG: bifunctional phosphopantothenoylcysteine decarboxylase/phosphopantothenate--cysteine ligase CoaBC [Bacteroidota bacterium]